MPEQWQLGDSPRASGVSTATRLCTPVPAQVPNQPRLAVDVSGLSQTLRSTSLGTVLSQRLVALGVQDGAMHDEQKGFERLTMIAESLQKGGAWITPCSTWTRGSSRAARAARHTAGARCAGADVEVSARLEDAALRVSALLNAAEEGVVFYFGEPSTNAPFEAPPRVLCPV